MWNWLQSVTSWPLLPTPPSSGFLGTMLLLHHCSTVHVFEYIPSMRLTKRLCILQANFIKIYLIFQQCYSLEFCFLSINEAGRFQSFFNSDVTTMTKRTILDALLETGILSPQKSWPHLASILVLTFRPEMEMGLAVIAKLTLKQNRKCNPYQSSFKKPYCFMLLSILWKPISNLCSQGISGRIHHHPWLLYLWSVKTSLGLVTLIVALN